MTPQDSFFTLLDLQTASLEIADTASRKLTQRVYDAALDAANRGAVKVACRMLREMPQAPHYDAIRYHATRGGK